MADFEVAIVGGGLAGLAAAIEMSRAGQGVVLFEKRSYPYHKVCGEYLSMESWNYLNYLGLNLEELRLPRINRLLVSDREGKSLKHRMPLGGFGISRYTLDAELARLAKEAGVTLLENCRVEKLEYKAAKDNSGIHIIKTEKGDYRSELLVASYGKRSRLDKNWQRNFISKPLPSDRNFMAVKYHIEADLEEDLIGLHIFDGGYCGISKVEGEKRFCLCYLTLASEVQAAGGVEALENEVMSKNPYLAKYLEYPRLYKAPEVISQVNFSSRTQIEEHAFMIGDTAGLIVPLCGNGMSMALHAAHLWSGLATKYFNGEFNRLQLEAAYRKAWNRQFKLRLKVGSSLQTLFYRHKLNSMMIGLLNIFPYLADQLIELTHGKEILD